MSPFAEAPAPGPLSRARMGTEPYLINLLNPPVDAIKGPAVCNVVDQDRTLGVRGTRLTSQDRHRRSSGPHASLWPLSQTHSQ